jgi:hypothetical protein
VGVILVNENPLKYFMNENAIENFACVCVYTYLSANDYMRSVGKQTGKKSCSMQAILCKLVTKYYVCRSSLFRRTIDRILASLFTRYPLEITMNECCNFSSLRRQRIIIIFLFFI